MFESVQGDETLVKCLPCSRVKGPTVFKKKHTSRHLKNKKHLSAIGEVAPILALHIAPSIVPAPVSQVSTNLQLAPTFASGSLAAQTNAEIRPTLPNVLSDWFVNEDGFVDLQGEPVMFSAGRLDPEDHIQDLVTGLNRGHYHFESFTAGLSDDLDPETVGQDSTVNPIVESLRAIGKLYKLWSGNMDLPLQ